MVKRVKLLVALLASVLLILGLSACKGTNSDSAAQNDFIDCQDTAAPGDNASSNAFYVLVVGNDSRTGTTEIDMPEYADGSARSDTMMLVRIDPSTYAVGIVTIPRDTAAEYNGSRGKLNEVYHVGGIEALSAEVGKLTGVTPKYYLDMGFIDFEQFIDALNGVDANVPIAMSLKDIASGNTINLSAGEQTLNGPEALVLARVRKQYAADQDACRQIQDRQLVQRGIQQIASNSGMVDAGVAALLANADTNWEAADLSATVKDFVEHADQITFVSGTGPYQGAVDENAGGLWLATRDEATWKKIIEALEEGKDPTTIVPLPAITVA